MQKLQNMFKNKMMKKNVIFVLFGFHQLSSYFPNSFAILMLHTWIDLSHCSKDHVIMSSSSHVRPLERKDLSMLGNDGAKGAGTCLRAAYGPPKSLQTISSNGALLGGLQKKLRPLRPLRPAHHFLWYLIGNEAQVVSPAICRLQ